MVRFLNGEKLVEYKPICNACDVCVFLYVSDCDVDTMTKLYCCNCNFQKGHKLMTMYKGFSPEKLGLSSYLLLIKPTWFSKQTKLRVKQDVDLIIIMHN